MNNVGKKTLDESLVQFYIERDLPLENIKKTLVKLCLVKSGIIDIYISNSSKFTISNIGKCSELCNYIGLNMDIIDVNRDGIIKWIGYRNITPNTLEYLKVPFYRSLIQAEMKGFRYPMNQKELIKCYEQRTQYRLYININNNSEWTKIIRDELYRYYKDNRINMEEILNTDIFNETISIEVLQGHIKENEIKEIKDYYGDMFNIFYITNK